MSSPLVPTAGQLAWQERGFGIFVHIGPNTFHGREWSDGTLDPRSFDPIALDARQWAETAREAGAAHVILTAKHHDGFCLWPTATTDYSVRSAPWRDGRGDVVGELAEACREVGIGLGLYLSPWDRHAPCYSDPDAYDRYYQRQLTELCTKYGPLAELWFDGAGSEGRRYDWDGVMAVIDRYQPDAMVFNMGRPTLRWVGNEDGLAADPCWYPADRTGVSLFEGEGRALDGVRYLPPECDVSIRRHWFWHPGEQHQVKSREHLLAIWYRSVGLGAGLLLNVPPDRSGRFDPVDRQRLLDFTGELRRRFAAPVAGELEPLPDGAAGGVRMRFGRPTELDHLELREELTTGQHIVRHEVRAPDGRLLASGGTVGVRRVHAFPRAVADTLEIRWSTAPSPDGTTELPALAGGLAQVRAFATGHEAVPALEPQPEFDFSRADEPERRRHA
ncbi:alpha-L-fucosidase [Streptacidiphilus sp. MAP12-20]|uniref:alpha-L-fucosidase n=1 Tax=Streptacidiphilus sp. MAP12-20 TaxID=3156299 RepID=UPI0035147329